MMNARDTRKEHCPNLSLALRRPIAAASFGSLLAVSILVAAGPVSAQTRKHTPTKSTPKPPATTTPGTNTGSTTSGNTSSSSNSSSGSTSSNNSSGNTSSSNSSSSTPKPPVSQGNPPTSSGAASIAAADSMRGLLVGVNLAGSITVARNAFPPVTMRVAPNAVITRDGAPARLTDLETGSRTSIPDAVLVSGGSAAGGTSLITKIKATSRDHYWYGRLIAIDPNTDTIVVLRADGQRHTFHLSSRSSVQQYGGKNVPWNVMRVGMQVEVVWIPGQSDDDAILEAHNVVLNKPYEGITRR
jgi:hypothetical protein